MSFLFSTLITFCVHEHHIIYTNFASLDFQLDLRSVSFFLLTHSLRECRFAEHLGSTQHIDRKRGRNHTHSHARDKKRVLFLICFFIFFYIVFNFSFERNNLILGFSFKATHSQKWSALICLSSLNTILKIINLFTCSFLIWIFFCSTIPKNNNDQSVVTLCDCYDFFFVFFPLSFFLNKIKWEKNECYFNVNRYDIWEECDVK